jgi:hypothetical protein
LLPKLKKNSKSREEEANAVQENLAGFYCFFLRSKLERSIYKLLKLKKTKRVTINMVTLAKGIW